MLKRNLALIVLALGGTLLNVEILETPPISNHLPVKSVATKSPVDDFVATARSYGLYPDTAVWADTPRRIAFSERETVLMTALLLVFITTVQGKKEL